MAIISLITEIKINKIKNKLKAFDRAPLSKSFDDYLFWRCPSFCEYPQYMISASIKVSFPWPQNKTFLYHQVIYKKYESLWCNTVTQLTRSQDLPRLTKKKMEQCRVSFFFFLSHSLVLKDYIFSSILQKLTFYLKKFNTTFKWCFLQKNTL